MKRQYFYHIFFLGIINLHLLIVFPGLTYSYQGELGQWTLIGSLPDSYHLHQCLSENNFIYCIGGKEDMHTTNKVWYTKINPDKSINEWQAATSLPDRVEDLQCFIENGYIYCAGGDNDKTLNFSYIDNVWYVKINADGSLLDWQAAASLPRKIRNHQCF